MSTESSDPMEWVDLTYEEALQHILWIQDPEVEDDMQIYFIGLVDSCLLYTSPSPRDQRGSRMPSSA